MDRRPSLLERAFELARQGANIVEIRVKLRAEGYDRVDEQTSGLSLKRQLRAAGAPGVTRESGREGGRGCRVRAPRAT